MNLNAWLAPSRTTLHFKLDQEALAQHHDLDAIKAQAAERLPGTGLWDGHPCLVVDPVLSAAEVRAARDKLDKDSEITVGDMLVALAIQEVRGDWRCYRQPISDGVNQQLAGWASLPLEAKVGFIKGLFHRDAGRLLNLVMDSSEPSEAELGN